MVQGTDTNTFMPPRISPSSVGGQGRLYTANLAALSGDNLFGLGGTIDTFPEQGKFVNFIEPTRTKHRPTGIAVER